ncbi:MAG: hypothetical protein N3B18_02955 [Desulfobacterota bacterium]|nr:hypothetical protein [Thermodesulfobacteriota bacterium]
MKPLLFIHPVGQACAFIFGLFNLLTGLTRRWFIIPLHINCGAIYYFVIFFGAVMGSLIAQWARSQGLPITMDAHKVTAMLMLILIAAGATTGVLLVRGSTQRKRLVRYHRWINIITIVLFIAQALSGVIMLVHIFRL